MKSRTERARVLLQQAGLLSSSILVAAFAITAHAQGAGKAASGKAIFEERCAFCHSTTNEVIAGPGLGGVFGHKAAASNFTYSNELRAAKLTWDAATLDKFLKDPSALVPGTTMPINVPEASDRRDVIAYLATLKSPLAAADNDKSSKSAAASPASVVNAADDGDWRNDKPGRTYHITADTLPPPFATPSKPNFPASSPRPEDAKLSLPLGFSISQMATLKGPRAIRVAPNGDIFVAETGAGQISVLRAADGASKATETSVFAEGLKGPFGIAFYPLGNKPQWVYVANNNSVVRFAYHNGDLKARSAPETLVEQLSGTSSYHTTRDITFSKDGKQMFVSVGSGSNVAEDVKPTSPAEIKQWEASRIPGAIWGAEANRGDVLVFDPQGKNEKIFAAGIRNCVGLTTHPVTGDIWCATNERDLLGDNLVPDYATHVKEGAFYGWPWYYLGDNPDPRWHDKDVRKDLQGKMTVPDVLFQSHSAPLSIVFYPAMHGVAAFPKEYDGDAFVAFHGSWNRATRTGYKVVRMKMKGGVATGEYQDFLTGFVAGNSKVWGQPVGVAVAHDGALLFTDDMGNYVWRVAYRAP